jgi:hypothetical protein
MKLRACSQRVCNPCSRMSVHTVIISYLYCFSSAALCLFPYHSVYCIWFYCAPTVLVVTTLHHHLLYVDDASERCKSFALAIMTKLARTLGPPTRRDWEERYPQKASKDTIIKLLDLCFLMFLSWDNGKECSSPEALVFKRTAQISPF